jgi:hypothetical protein
MDRRSFIKAGLASVTATTAMIKFENTADAKLLVPSRDIMIAQPTAVEDIDNPFIGDGMVYIRTGRDEFTAIGMITEFKKERLPINVTTAFDDTDKYILGMPRWNGSFRGPIR